MRRLSIVVARSAGRPLCKQRLNVLLAADGLLVAWLPLVVLRCHQMARRNFLLSQFVLANLSVRPETMTQFWLVFAAGERTFRFQSCAVENWGAII
jgi:hypothetical protein